MFSYLDASARPEAAEARQLVESWLEDYPADMLGRWLGDFRNNDDGQHDSAFFELFLFQFFKAAGWSVTVEPQLDGLQGRPDFLIENSDGLRIVVEAISPNAKSDEMRGKEKLTADIKDAINSIKISDYYLVFEAVEAPAQSINKAKLIEALQGWLETGPAPDQIFEYQDRGALVKIQVIHRPGRKTDDPNYRSIGIEMGGVSVSTPGEVVKRALQKKAGKYRELELPYLIALNARGFHDTEDDYLAATYGTLAVRFSLGPEGAEREPEMIRNHDGLFNEGGRPRKTNVSAALIFNGIAPWNWRDRRSCMIHNAYAERLLEDLTFSGDGYLPNGGILQKFEGLNVAALFENSAKKAHAIE
jgi:hypothetical protein